MHNSSLHAGSCSRLAARDRYSSSVIRRRRRILISRGGALLLGSVWIPVKYKASGGTIGGMRSVRPEANRLAAQIDDAASNPGLRRTSVDFRGSPRTSFNTFQFCVSSIPRFCNRIRVLQRPGTVYKTGEAVGTNVWLLGDRPRRSAVVRREPKNLGATLGATRHHQNSCPQHLQNLNNEPEYAAATLALQQNFANVCRSRSTSRRSWAAGFDFQTGNQIKDPRASAMFPSCRRPFRSRARPHSQFASTLASGFVLLTRWLQRRMRHCSPDDVVTVD
jgi:hypothetical protein